MDLAPSLGSNGQSHRYSVRFGPGPERALGLARVWTAVGIFLLVCLRPPSSDIPSNQAALCASAFVFYSFVLFILLRNPRNWSYRARLWLHAGDMFWAVIFPLVVPEPRVFMLAFLFVLTAAALRWSPSRVLETSGAIALLAGVGLLIEHALPGGGSWDAFVFMKGSYFFWGIFALFADGLIWFLARREAAQRWKPLPTRPSGLSPASPSNSTTALSRAFFPSSATSSEFVRRSTICPPKPRRILRISKTLSTRPR